MSTHPHSAADEVYETIGRLAATATLLQRVSMDVNDVGTEDPVLGDEQVVELYQKAEAILDKAAQDLYAVIKDLRARIGRP